MNAMKDKLNAKSQYTFESSEKKSKSRSLTIEDNHTYKRLEGLVNKLKDKALSGMENKMLWWDLVCEVEQLVDAGEEVASSCRLCHIKLSIGQRQKVRYQLKHVRQLLFAYQECMQRVASLDVDYTEYLDQVSVLLINTINHLMKQVEIMTQIFNMSPGLFSNNNNFRANFTSLQNCCEQLATKTSIEPSYMKWQNCVFLMFIIIHKSFKSLFLLVDASDVANVNLLSDWTKTDDIIRQLCNHIDEKIFELKYSLDEETDDGTSNLVSAEKIVAEKLMLKKGWTEKLEKIKALLNVYKYHSTTFLPLPPPGSPSQSLLTISADPPPQSSSFCYPFDEDTFKLTTLICEILLSKCDRLMLNDVDKKYNGEYMCPTLPEAENNDTASTHHISTAEASKNKNEVLELLADMKLNVNKFINDMRSAGEDKVEPELIVWLDQMVNKDMKILDNSFTDMSFRNESTTEVNNGRSMNK
ncbi:hypothetical protein HELRODRAFT_160948 [Helobdella robusta]|uniref:Uncharacterized protein n=1 Tax=Helobdella robusta TaxID=6412 RepID=T1EQW6_HELRO|nr:hypothetical protein HELRODRAFT_160948 [Helobdella robusta]ESO01786.1 hypothetical protein HELRODRAFT_160948 [Helobdella robusta]